MFAVKCREEHQELNTKEIPYVMKKYYGMF